MPIREHPKPGTILLCNFTDGFHVPEAVKRRPVVVVSPKIAARPGLCTVVVLSTTPPRPVMPYHAQLDIIPRLPEPLVSDGVWVKGDLVYAVSLARLDFIRTGKDQFGNRLYHYQAVAVEDLQRIRHCILHGLGMGALTSRS